MDLQLGQISYCDIKRLLQFLFAGPLQQEHFWCNRRYIVLPETTVAILPSEKVLEEIHKNTHHNP